VGEAIAMMQNNLISLLLIPFGMNGIGEPCKMNACQIYYGLICSAAERCVPGKLPLDVTSSIDSLKNELVKIDSIENIYNSIKEFA
jgi:hypothetical protein